MLTRRSRYFLGALLALALAACAPRLHAAPITYTYTGTPFTDFANGFTCTLPFCGLEGSITLSAPLGANVWHEAVTPLSYSFTDGRETFNGQNSGIASYVFYFSTDWDANITSWNFQVQHTRGALALIASAGPDTYPSGDQSYDMGGGAPRAGTSAYGSWQVASEVPEPSSWALLATGVLALLALGPVCRRRSAASPVVS